MTEKLRESRERVIYDPLYISNSRLMVQTEELSLREENIIPFTSDNGDGSEINTP